MYAFHCPSSTAYCHEIAPPLSKLSLSMKKTFDSFEGEDDVVTDYTIDDLGGRSDDERENSINESEFYVGNNSHQE